MVPFSRPRLRSFAQKRFQREIRSARICMTTTTPREGISVPSNRLFAFGVAIGERLYQHDTISAMELIGDLGDINKVKAMLRELLDGAKLVIVEGGVQLILKPPEPPK